MDRFERLASALRRIPGLEVRENEPMKRHTTFRIGGPARLMALPRSRKEAAAAVRAATEAGIAPFFLGNGSNLLVADHGYEGFVLKACGLDQVREVNRRLRAESGITLARLANAALGRGLTGLEFAHGIPGTLGGAVVMNAGAYGGEMVQVLTAVTYLDGAGEEHTLPAAACALTYRHSRFSDRPDWLVLEAELELRPGDGEAIRARMDELAAKRREKQPLEWPSGGSTFKRPEGHFAAALIEGCGLKGVGIGGAQVSEKHAGFVVNRGGATADDVRRLMALVQETVLRETGVALVTDIRGGQTFDGLFDALHELHRMGCAYKILFVEASVETIIKRYKETRRMHPLSSTSRSLDEAVRQERTVLAPVRQRAEYIIDTSALSTAKLRGEVLRLFGDGGSTPAMSVSVISFGFKYGIPIEADLVFDVRFLPNPYYIAELRHQTGLDEGVYSFVFGYQQTKDFMAHLESLIGFLLPQYVEEGKAALVIGIGCTGGQHRSVAITKALADFIKQKGYQATENHRDMTRA